MCGAPRENSLRCGREHARSRAGQACQPVEYRERQRFSLTLNQLQVHELMANPVYGNSRNRGIRDATAAAGRVAGRLGRLLLKYQRRPADSLPLRSTVTSTRSAIL
jgi:hypothetical protein